MTAESISSLKPSQRWRKLRVVAALFAAMADIGCLAFINEARRHKDATEQLSYVQNTLRSYARVRAVRLRTPDTMAAIDSDYIMTPYMKLQAFDDFILNGRKLYFHVQGDQTGRYYEYRCALPPDMLTAYFVALTTNANLKPDLFNQKLIRQKVSVTVAYDAHCGKAPHIDTQDVHKFLGFAP